MKKIYFLLLIGLLILLVLPRFLSSYALGVFILIFFYAYLGQSWNVLTGYTGMISLGHSLYVAIGAYMTYLMTLTLGISPIGMWIGGICAGLIGLIIGFFGFRFGLQGVYFVLLTIAFAEIGRLIFLHLKVFGSFQGLFMTPQFSFTNFQFKENVPYYYIALHELRPDSGVRRTGGNGRDVSYENRPVYPVDPGAAVASLVAGN